VRFEGNPAHVQLFGTRGQDQSGIDIYSQLFTDSYATYQCKRYDKFADNDAENAVAKFLKEDWADKSERLGHCR
jgi:hypothetical protein